MEGIETIVTKSGYILKYTPPTNEELKSDNTLTSEHRILTIYNCYGNYIFGEDAEDRGFFDLVRKEIDSDKLDNLLNMYDKDTNSLQDYLKIRKELEDFLFLPLPLNSEDYFISDGEIEIASSYGRPIFVGGSCSCVSLPDDLVQEINSEEY